ncbi:MAG: hypothetical protein ACLUKH_22815 [Flavonifractor plautii]
MKKIISLFIALCIALSLSVPVFAATSDSPITISSEDVSTNWPYTEKSISLDFTFEATDNT